MIPNFIYPLNWWKGVEDYGYMEVTAASGPGLACSPPLCWYDGWVGSGQFLFLGKSHRARNKGDATTLAKEMSKSSEGRDRLVVWFGTSDPYEVVKNVGFYKPYYLSNLVDPDPKISIDVNSRGALVSTFNGKGSPVKCNFCNISWSQSYIPNHYTYQKPKYF